MVASIEPVHISYFKRFRMEIELYEPPPFRPVPEGYSLVPWDDSLMERHAEVLYYSFCDEIDAKVFPSFGSRQGCSSLMKEIRRKSGFLPEATWLLVRGEDVCGSIQGLRERTGVGAIQNVGVTGSHRGKGLGTLLLTQALHGFRRAGLGRALLEVTAQNDRAVQLYWRLGFRRRKTVYKAVQAPPAG
jgi:ribosomal protein S18 acetylase RimI-like enzyme